MRGQKERKKMFTQKLPYYSQSLIKWKNSWCSREGNILLIKILWLFLLLVLSYYILKYKMLELCCHWLISLVIFGNSFAMITYGANAIDCIEIDTWLIVAGCIHFISVLFSCYLQCSSYASFASNTEFTSGKILWFRILYIALVIINLGKLLFIK